MAIKIKAVPRAAMDTWPLDESGLLVRATRAAHEAGLQTVGQLRGCSDEKLLSLWSFGRITLTEVHAFFRFCDRLEQGRQTFRDLREVLELFLQADQRDILFTRFQLIAAASATPWRRISLQAIGSIRKLTRERVRQIEAKALASLQSRAAQLCLEPFYVFITTWLDRHEKVADPVQFQNLRTEPLLGGLHPAGVLALLVELAPARLLYRHGRFFSLSEQELQRLEQAVLAILNRKAKPLAAAQLLAEVRRQKAVGLPAGIGLNFLCTWLDHHPATGATADGRYFSLATGAPAFVAEVARGLRRPFHYRRLLEVVNSRLKPGSRRGAGTILEWLGTGSGFTRIGRGLYDYKV